MLPKLSTSSEFDLSFASSTSTPLSTSHNSSFVSSKNTSFSTDNATSSEESSPEYFSCPEKLIDSDKESETGVHFSPNPLENLFHGVFPQFGNGSFNDAPFHAVWDITRIALHCGVKLDEINIQHRDSGLWDNQSKLRDFLSQHKAFKNKELPEPASEKCWNVASSSFLSQHDAVVLSGRLEPNKDGNGPPFSLKLDPLHTKKGHRLIRRFGSDRFLELSIPSMGDQEATKCTDDSITRWMAKKKHYFLGRQWSAFFCKRDEANNKKRREEEKGMFWIKMVFFACDGDSFRKSIEGGLPPHDDAKILKRRVKVDLHQVISWAIGDLKTTNQQMAKLFSRIGLNLTDTTATVVLERHQIYHWPEDIGKTPMNDGIGQMSGNLAKRISSCLGLTEVPSAFQARFGSAKGMWIVDDRNAPPSVGGDDWIVTYPSQRKWDCDDEDAHHRTFEVHKWSQEPKPASLNQQFIPLLEAQAIDPKLMRSTIANHLRRGLEDSLEELKNAMFDPVDLRLWLQQARGSSSDTTTSLHDDQVPYLGGLPRRTEDVIATLVDSGFGPRTCKYLQSLCLSLGKQQAEALKKKMSIQVPCSTYLFMVVDFSSTLAENEVHVSFSSKFQVEGFCDTLLENMDILVARAPAHLPTDIQRVKVVSLPQLRHLKDVIVFSTRGDKPLADKLSGGDYDGDKAWVCWDQAIVQNFRNAPTQVHDLNPLKYVGKLNLPMGRIREKAKDVSDICADFINEGIAFNLHQSHLGICTKFKEDYCRSRGSVSSPEIILLSELLSLLVDQTKQGYIFTQEHWRKFRDDLKQLGSVQGGPCSVANRKQNHILDYLVEEAQSIVHETLTKLSNVFDESEAHWFDKDLTAKFNTYDEHHRSVPEWTKLRDKLRHDIDSLADRWFEEIAPEDKSGAYVDKVTKFYPQWQRIQPLEELESSKFIQTLFCDGAKNIDSSPWELLKASFAMKRLQGPRSKFVWQMAGRQLGFLKLSMSPRPYTAMTSEMYAAMRCDKKVAARRRARRLGDQGMPCHALVDENHEMMDGD